MPRLYEALDDLEHLRNGGRRARLVSGRQDADRRVAAGELELHSVRERPPRLAGGRIRQHLVVDVGDVAHEGHATEAVGQPPAEDVEAQRAPKVTDVRARL